ncbi:microsomal glutathione S-transferase 1 [Microplitis demolitor]|uniref:microsomal glutathione S-transferase 1 n=1 Tax=Microplitis demolitor TaxID=69319 RepID=UPI0004CD3ACD|nr:microsomal glutathione S-transferase 1 [Microplitis demolitor]
MAVIRDDLLKEFGFWSAVLVLKILMMAVLTARQRFSKKAFANAEDLPDKSAKISTADPDVERVRRAHLNDLENILPWFVITLVWLSTGPSHFLAMVLIRTFTISRIIHTIAYAIFAAQPYRAIAWFVGYGITIYQTISAMIYYF